MIENVKHNDLSMMVSIFLPDMSRINAQLYEEKLIKKMQAFLPLFKLALYGSFCVTMFNVWTWSQVISDN